MGILRSQVNINDLELIDEQTISGDGVPAMRTKQKGNGSGKIRMSKSATVSPEINLIGKQLMRQFQNSTNISMMLIWHILKRFVSYTDAVQVPLETVFISICASSNM